MAIGGLEPLSTKKPGVTPEPVLMRGAQPDAVRRRPDFCRKPDSGFLTVPLGDGKEIDGSACQFEERSFNRSPHRARFRSRWKGRGPFHQRRDEESG